MDNPENDTGTGFRWSFIQGPILWIIKKAGEDWIRGIIKQTVRDEKDEIISSSIIVQRLKAYDEIYGDFSKRLAFAIGRYFEHGIDPDKYDEVHVMKQVNEVRQARHRFLSVCGPKIKSYLEKEGSHWLKDPKSFVTIAEQIAEALGHLVSEDRQSVANSGRVPRE